MPSFRDTIIGLMPTIAKEDAKAAAEADKASRKARQAEAEEERLARKARAKAAKLGGEVVQLLEERGIERVPVLRSRKSGPLYADGTEGWLIGDGRAIITTGVLVEPQQSRSGGTPRIDRSSSGGTTREDIPAIVNPTDVEPPRTVVAYFESEVTQAGLARILNQAVKGPGDTQAAPSDPSSPEEAAALRAERQAAHEANIREKTHAATVAAEVRERQQAKRDALFERMGVEGLITRGLGSATTAGRIIKPTMAVQDESGATITVPADIHYGNPKAQKSCTGNCPEDSAVRTAIQQGSTAKVKLDFQGSSNQGYYVTATRV